MGAAFAGRGGATLLPLAITGRATLSPIRYDTPVPSAQVKSAVLLAGLAADGETAVTEAVATRDHTERMLRARGIAVEETTGPDGAHTVRLDGPIARSPRSPRPSRPTRRARPSGSSPGPIHPDAELRLEGVSTNPTRRAIIDILRRMGASIEEHDRPAPGGADGEPLADLVVRSSRAPGRRPVARRRGGGDRRDPDPGPGRRRRAMARPGSAARGELRHKESDRIAGIADGLTALGARVRVEGDDIEIHGGRRLTGAVTETHDDHRLAMTFAIAGLIAEGETIVRRPGSAAISYPGFFERTRRGAGMTKRVVLIGHPVAHSLSGAMQQAAFDTLGIDATLRAVGPRPDRARRRDRRAAHRRLPGRQRHDPPQGAGRARRSTA